MSDLFIPVESLLSRLPVHHYDFACELDENEFQRFLIARSPFLNCLISDERVQATFKEWADKDKLLDKAHQVHSVATGMAKSLGVDPTELVATFLEEKDPSDAFLVQIAGQKNWRKLSNRLCGAVDVLEIASKKSSRTLAAKTLHLVRDQLALDWPWVCTDLMIGFRCQLLMTATGLQYVIGEPYDTFPAFEGESLIAHLARSFEATKLKIARTRTRRAPKNSGEHLCLYAEWLYRAEVKKPKDSIRKIATDYHELKCNGTVHQSGYDHRAEIRNGIRVVTKLLALPGTADTLTK